MHNKRSHTRIPTLWIGPIFFEHMYYSHQHIESIELNAPLATYETTLFHSVNRGAKVTRLAKSLKTTLLSDFMTRSLLFEANSAQEAHQVALFIEQKLSYLQEHIVQKSSRFAKLEKVDTKIVGTLLYVRLAFQTGEASGHNMATFASDEIGLELLKTFPNLKYISVSGNYCVDKKVSAVNSVLGRGKHVIAEIFISNQILEDVLRTTAQKMVELNIKKNLIGSIVSGSLMSANAHYANMLLAFYLATGQDAANIVEGSQGITYCEARDGGLYFSVSLPNIIVGTVGHGKDALDAHHHLEQMNCLTTDGAQKVAQIAAALVLCGELSLMAALTNQNELTSSHKNIERKSS
jgi:hydroxymethylglutaryl-CoA reductase (NADPH)